jgi:hypothetical protein
VVEVGETTVVKEKGEGGGGRDWFRITLEELTGPRGERAAQLQAARERVERLEAEAAANTVALRAAGFALRLAPNGDAEVWQEAPNGWFSVRTIPRRRRTEGDGQTEVGDSPHAEPSIRGLLPHLGIPVRGEAQGEARGA